MTASVDCAVRAGAGPAAGGCSIAGLSEQPQQQTQQQQQQQTSSSTAGAPGASGASSLGRDVVHLNVGGMMFTTTVGTLSRDGGSILARLCAGCWRGAAPPGEAVFFDRDGERFRHVLNFLRNGTLPRCEDALYAELLEEADFFCLSSLREVIEDAQQQRAAEVARSRKRGWGAAGADGCDDSEEEGLAADGDVSVEFVRRLIQGAARLVLGGAAARKAPVFRLDADF